MKKNLHILVGVTGSIAAYKTADLIRRMKDHGWDVSVVMTRAATEFVSELTFCTLSQNPVGIDMFAAHEDWKPKHIAYQERAQIFIIAPCTANVMAKIAHGIADDLLCCTALTVRVPTIIAPAMNVNMWMHPATQANVQILKKRGIILVPPEHGALACGVQGKGRMAEVEDIMKIVTRIARHIKKTNIGGLCHD